MVQNISNFTQSVYLCKTMNISILFFLLNLIFLSVRFHFYSAPTMNRVSCINQDPETNYRSDQFWMTGYQYQHLNIIIVDFN